jgi:hypothetical protein
MSARYAKAMKIKEELKLTTEERHELAKLLPGVKADHSGSWKDLTEEQLHELLTMMEGYLLIRWLFLLRTGYPNGVDA